ncbi:MAG TPA: hypothetical protein PK440_22120 [Candidatus Accumulibacter phosphatis]|nr:hypothetical protein [Candidatus Accumulibacter phosphatis]
MLDLLLHPDDSLDVCEIARLSGVPTMKIGSRQWTGSDGMSMNSETLPSSQMLFGNER